MSPAPAYWSLVLPLSSGLLPYLHHAVEYKDARGARARLSPSREICLIAKWVADEILYQAAIHPACPVPHVSPDDITRLHHWIRKVPEIAVGVNADSRHFPEGWLFRWRWGKGKKQERRVAKAVEGGKVVSVKEEVKVLDTADGVKREVQSDGEGEGEGSEGEEVGDVKPKGVDFLALVRPYVLHRGSSRHSKAKIGVRSGTMPSGLSDNPGQTALSRHKDSPLIGAAEWATCNHNIHRSRRTHHCARIGDTKDARRHRDQAQDPKRGEEQSYSFTRCKKVPQGGHEKQIRRHKRQ